MDRYIRQRIIKETGDIQARLRKKTVAILGLGGIGCMSAQLLARYGVGKIIVVDKDIVAIDNIHRQILYDEDDVGRSKVKVAVERLSRINSEIIIYGIEMDITGSNLRKIKADLILDCTDNLAARKAISAHCEKIRIPWIFASAQGTKALVHTIPAGSEWFNRTFGNKRGFLTPELSGVMNTVCNAIACMQVTQAIRLLIGKKVRPELVRLDIWDVSLERIKT